MAHYEAMSVFAALLAPAAGENEGDKETDTEYDTGCSTWMNIGWAAEALNRDISCSYSTGRGTRRTAHRLRDEIE